MERGATMHEYTQLLIAGRWMDPAGRGVVEVRSPHDQSLVGRAPEGSRGDVDRAVEAARAAFDDGPWAQLQLAQRIEIIERLAAAYESRVEEIAALTTAENGTTISFCRRMTGLQPQRIRNWIDAAREFDWKTVLPGAKPGHGTVVLREPVGVVAAIVPWNAPQSLALVKIVPALLAGCPVIVKASPETAIDGMLLAEILFEAGFPEGAISVFPADREVSEYLVAHPGVDKISFTGSTATGRRIGAVAADRVARVSLELGGKSAAIVLEDADLGAFAVAVKDSSMPNNGEGCVSHTRILAPLSRYDEVVAAVARVVNSVRIGDPADPSTELGPMATAAQQQKVERYIALGVEEGARLVAGGPGGPDIPGLEQGFYVRPTVFADVKNSMQVARDEIFGPVLCIIAYEDEADAIHIANDSVYGLDGGIWTSDVEHGLELAGAIRTGGLHINGAAADPAAPFGGFKQSGIGRERGSAGLAQYTEYKSIGF
jgi:aldehyde dehydrogenase (NAD+)